MRNHELYRTRVENQDCEFHDRTVVVTSCGRLCLYNEKINLNLSLAGQAVGVKEVDHGIWLVSFMDYDLGYIDLEKNFAAPAESLRTKSVTFVSGTFSWLAKRQRDALLAHR